LVALVIIVTIALTVFVVWLSIRAHRHQALAGREELIGKTAEVLTVMEPKGTVFIQGERWTAISESDRIEPGEEVIITKVNGLKMWVIRKQ
jgi:membrane-bound ClpP family serine protease